MSRKFAVGLALLVLTGVSLLAVAWQEKKVDKSRPAYEVYKNLTLFHDERVSVAWLDRTMQNLNKYLGVECTHCHEQDNWAKDDLSKEQMHAREMMTTKMFPMVGVIRQDYFEGKGGPTCWTCHRGSTKPEQRPEKPFHPKIPDPSPFRNEDQSAGQVHKNLKIFKEFPARLMERVMTGFSRSLGVECVHCHVEGKWESDEKELKQMVAKMIELRNWIQTKYFDGQRIPTCWTCHRGSNKPEMRPPD